MAKSTDARFIVLVYCPNCSSPVSANDGSCKNCHTTFEEGTFCSHCGEKVSTDADVCDSCGAAFTTFYEFECPSCKHGVSEDARGCANCGDTFFKPIKRRINRSNHRKNHKKVKPLVRTIATGPDEVKGQEPTQIGETPQNVQLTGSQAMNAQADHEVKIPNLETRPLNSSDPLVEVPVQASQQPLPPLEKVPLVTTETNRNRFFSFLRKRKAVAEQLQPQQAPVIESTPPVSIDAQPTPNPSGGESYLDDKKALSTITESKPLEPLKAQAPQTLLDSQSQQTLPIPQSHQELGMKNVSAHLEHPPGESPPADRPLTHSDRMEAGHPLKEPRRGKFFMHFKGH